jgi:F0F1-type ATP synthase assembly protein I
VKNDSHQNLVQVRRSSGEEEWMTKEKLAALNKQRALKREKSEKTIKQSRSKRTKWTTISLLLNAVLLIALLGMLLYSLIDSGF